MTNEQLYILLRTYRDRLYQIVEKHSDCSEHTEEIICATHWLAKEIQEDMDILKPPVVRQVRSRD